MRLYEFEGKELFRKFKIPVPNGQVATTPGQAEEATAKTGGSAVLKSQVLTGGRGKAGGIKLVSSPGEARAAADALFKLQIKGFPVERLLVEPKLAIQKEFYVGVTIDRANYKIVVIASGEGGVDIEETAAKHPDKIVRLSLGVEDDLYTYDALGVAKKIGIPQELLKEVHDD